MIVQCKAWNSYRIGIKHMRELLGVMTDQKVSEGVFVTSGTFTFEARAFAARNNIVLFDGADFIRKITSTLTEDKSQALLATATAGDYLTPTCPSCAVKMVARKNPDDGDKFWGCRNYPRCRQTFFGSTNAPP